MNALLTAVQAALIAGMGTSVTGVLILAEEGVLPESVTFPVLGVLDGGETYEPARGHRLEALSVDVPIYQEVIGDDDAGSLLGDGTSTGVLAIAASVDAILRDLLPAGYSSVESQAREKTHAYNGETGSAIVVTTCRATWKRVVMT